jgi:hypothetical protein
MGEWKVSSKSHNLGVRSARLLYSAVTFRGSPWKRSCMSLRASTGAVEMRKLNPLSHSRCSINCTKLYSYKPQAPFRKASWKIQEDRKFVLLNLYAV